MWQAQEIAAALAEAYHDAALAGADMRQVANGLESIREVLVGADRPFCAWEAIDDRVGEAFGQPDLPILLALRRHFVARVIADELERIRAALATDPVTGTHEYLAAIAEAISSWRPELHEPLAAAELDVAAELQHAVDIVRGTAGRIRQERWPEAYPVYQLLADAEFVPTAVRARLCSIAGQIHLYHFPGRNRSAELIERALDLAPDDPDLLVVKGQLLLQQHDVEAAQSFARQALEAQPTCAAAHCLLGDCSGTLLAYDSAEEYYLEAMRVRPGESLGYLRLIQLTGKPRTRFDLERVPDLVERGLTVDPCSEPRILVEAGNTYQQRGALDEALRLYDRATERFPDFLHGHTFRAYLSLDRGDKDAARVTFEHVIELAPDAYDGYWGLALLAEEADDARGAERWYRKGAKRVSSWSARFRAKAAQLAWRQGRHATAEKELFAAAADGGDDFVLDTIERVAQELRRAGEFADAVVFCERIKAAVGASYEGRYEATLGDLYSAEGNYTEALKRYRAATALEPEKATHYVKVVRTLRLMRDWDGSRGLYEAAPRRVQADESFQHEVALLRNDEANQLYSAGRYREAVDLYSEAVERNPTDDVLQSNLAMAWERDHSWPDSLARLDYALDALHRASELAPQKSEYGRRIARLSTLRVFVQYYGKSAELLPLVTPIAVEVAGDLIPLVEGVDAALAPEFGRLVSTMRESLWDTYGVRIPGVRVRGNETDMPAGSYLIMLGEVPIVMGRIEREKRLALASVARLRAKGLEGEPARNPETGDEACWVDQPNWERAEQAGFELWNSIEYPVRHLRALLEQNLIEFLGHQEVLALLEEHDSQAVRALLARPEALTPLTAVLRGLVAEQAPITALDALCARFLELLDAGRMPVAIVEELRLLPEVRAALPGNRVGTSLFILDEALERTLGDSLHRDGDRVLLAMTPEDCQRALAGIRIQVGNCASAALVVHDPEIRPFARKLFELEFPKLAVLARRELLPGLERNLVSVVRLEEETVG